LSAGFLSSDDEIHKQKENFVTKKDVVQIIKGLVNYYDGKVLELNSKI